MKVLCCNIQGGKKPQAFAELIFLKNRYKPDTIFIIETVTNSRNNNKILKALYFDNKLLIDLINHCGVLE